jgi:hypothetical protein
MFPGPSNQTVALVSRYCNTTFIMNLFLLLYTFAERHNATTGKKALAKKAGGAVRSTVNSAGTKI